MKKHHERASIRILVVEDSRTQAEYLRHILETEGYTVTLAANGSDALKQIRTDRPTIVLTDILMPEMDGYSLCRAIRQIDELADLPVILVTQLFDPVDLIKGLEAGADNIIIKPFEAEHVKVRITDTLRLRGHHDSDDTGTDLEVSLEGRTHQIPASKFHSPAILLSTYDLLVRKNAELQAANERLTAMNENLQKAVDSLQRANEKNLASTSSENPSGTFKLQALRSDRKMREHS